MGGISRWMLIGGGGGVDAQDVSIGRAHIWGILANMFDLSSFCLHGEMVPIVD